ncbi:MAG TPA: serine/threonine-protein kinase, partial [Planctomycetota bacterium]|nr:serine/threonine-protein kinase [Planctomycetota bacterium]
AHAKGIVHRDVKPENVLRQGDRWLLADLGIAKHFDDSAEGASRSVSLSKTGTLRGTFGYMAPEQLTDAKSAGPPADVFALGVLLYECLAGEPPFEGATVILVVQAVVDGHFAPLGKRRPEVPSALAGAIHRALAADPDARPVDAAAFLDELERAGTGRSSRTLLAVLGVLVALLVAAVAAVALSRRPDSAAPPPPPPTPAPRTLDRELRALLEAHAAPSPEVVAAVASAWKDERIHADALALADRHPEPFVRALEPGGEPRVLLAHAWLAGGAVTRREDVRASIGNRDVVAAMTAVDRLVTEPYQGRFRGGAEDGKVVLVALANVKPATRAAIAVVLAPITTEALAEFENDFDRPPWLAPLVDALGDECPLELVALVALARNVSAPERLAPLIRAFPASSALGAAVRYRELMTKAETLTTPEGFRELAAKVAAIHSEAKENVASLHMWIEVRESVQHFAAARNDWDDAIAFARETLRGAPDGPFRRRAGRDLAVLELANDRARTEVEGADVWESGGTSALHAELLRRRGELEAARKLLVPLTEDAFALGILVRVEGQLGNLAAARRVLAQLEKKGVPEELAWLDTTVTLRVWLDELEAKAR